MNHIQQKQQERKAGILAAYGVTQIEKSEDNKELGEEAKSEDTKSEEKTEEK